MSVFAVTAIPALGREHLAGVATSYTGAVDLAWEDARTHWETFDAYAVTEMELDTAGLGLHDTYFERGGSKRRGMDVLRFREGWKTLGGMKVPYEDPRRIVPQAEPSVRQTGRPKRSGLACRALRSIRACSAVNLGFPHRPQGYQGLAHGAAAGHPHLGHPGTM